MRSTGIVIKNSEVMKKFDEDMKEKLTEQYNIMVTKLRDETLDGIKEQNYNIEFFTNRLKFAADETNVKNLKSILQTLRSNLQTFIEQMKNKARNVHASKEYLRIELKFKTDRTDLEFKYLLDLQTDICERLLEYEQEHETILKQINEKYK